jgi:hypothetical protein
MDKGRKYRLECIIPRVFLLLVTASMLFSLATKSSLDSEASSLEQKKEDLNVILQKAGDYCLKLERAALDFVCREEVDECIYHPYNVSSYIRPDLSEARPEINHYVYDYLLIRNREIKESRILLKENGAPCHIEDAPLKVKRFAFKYIIFGPIGLIGHKSQPLYEYVFKGYDKLWGHRTAILEANPKSDKNEKLYGRLWVDRETGGVLKISWEQASLGNYYTLLEETKDFGQPSIKFESEYKFEKNGLRFPSRYYVIEKYILRYNLGINARTAIERREKSRLTATYNQYRFFTVQTTIRY